MDVLAEPGDGLDEQLVRQLAARARAEGLRLAGEGGLLGRLTKVVVESALEGEMDDHVGYGKHDPAGRNGGNSRNGTWAKTLVTEAGPVEIEVPRDRESTFEPVIVGKRQRRLSGIDDLVISLSAKGLTHGEICAHLAEIYGAEVSKQTISAITDRVMEGMAAWQNRPLAGLDGRLALVYSRSPSMSFEIEPTSLRRTATLTSGPDSPALDGRPALDQPTHVTLTTTTRRWSSRMR